MATNRAKRPRKPAAAWTHRRYGYAPALLVIDDSGDRIGLWANHRNSDQWISPAQARRLRDWLTRWLVWAEGQGVKR